MRIILLFLVGCAQTPAPYVQVVGDVDLTLAVSAVGAWSALGFEGQTAPSGLPECDEPWIDSHEACQVTLTLRGDPGLFNRDTGDGHTVGHLARKTRTITLDTDYLKDDRLLHTMTHEIGHAILNCDHLWDTQHGIMNRQATWLLQPTQDDYDLACAEVGLCYTTS